MCISHYYSVVMDTYLRMSDCSPAITEQVNIILPLFLFDVITCRKVVVVEVAQSSIVPLHILFTAHHPQAFSVCKQSEHLKNNHAIISNY